MSHISIQRTPNAAKTAEEHSVFWSFDIESNKKVALQCAREYVHKKYRSADMGLVSSATQEQSAMKLCSIRKRKTGKECHIDIKRFSVQSLHPGDIRKQGRGGHHAIKKGL